MWPFKKKETRSLESASDLGAELLQALIGTNVVTKEMAMEIPSINASVSLIQGVVASLPIKLYENKGESVEEIKDDVRTDLLNRDTKGTMTGAQLKKAIIENYLMGKGAFIYVDKVGTKFKSLRLVEDDDISITHNDEPIFKDYSILVRGNTYFPSEFIKIIRKTTDGFTGKSIIDECPNMISTAYNTLIYEDKIVKKGGNKRGFITSDHNLSEAQVTALKTAWNNLYQNNTDNVVVLNKGMEFKESSNTSVEMQLNQNKLTNSEELTMMFNVGNKMVRGEASNNDISNFVKFCIVPILVDIEDALNRDLLLEKEKSTRYFSFDTVELNRGSFKERMEAYKTALDSNIMLLDEVREKEDLPKLDFDYIKLGLDSVLYNLTDKTIYTPNTNQLQKMDMNPDEEGGDTDESGNQNGLGAD